MAGAEDRWEAAVERRLLTNRARDIGRERWAVKREPFFLTFRAPDGAHPRTRGRGARRRRAGAWAGVHAGKSRVGIDFASNRALEVFHEEAELQETDAPPRDGAPDQRGRGRQGLRR